MDLECARLVVRIYYLLPHLPSNITADVCFGLAVAGECQDEAMRGATWLNPAPVMNRRRCSPCCIPVRVPSSGCDAER